LQEGFGRKIGTLPLAVGLDESYAQHLLLVLKPILEVSMTYWRAWIVTIHSNVISKKGNKLLDLRVLSYRDELTFTVSMLSAFFKGFFYAGFVEAMLRLHSLETAKFKLISQCGGLIYSSRAMTSSTFSFILLAVSSS
jgi:hypothetical protein